MVLDFNTLGKSFFTGVLIQVAPNMLKGAMNEFLNKVKLSDLAELVKNDQNLWDMVDPGQQRNFIEFAPKLGPLNWLTKEWIMEEGKEAAPALYSALQGWPEGQEWLERQVEDIKDRLTGGIDGAGISDHPR